MATASTPTKSGGASAKAGPTGRTDNGTEFAVPKTYDLVHNLSGLKFNVFETIAISLCIGQLLLFIFGCPQWIIIALFGFWRLMYNVGLGVILHKQSTERFVTNLLVPYLSEGSKHRDFLRRQITMKMEADYDFDAVPIDYNVWLLFRFFVDTVLWNDFSTYFIVAFSCWEHPNPFTFVDGLFHLLGFGLCVLCYFIKVDAIRVVGDFAWYWGDFFFLIDSELTFDGVFQMAPHPMYSIGYLGFYGICIMARSYPLLYVSLVAHFCQFLFLHFAENPHIEKTYNSMVDESERFRAKKLHRGPESFFHRDLIVLKGLDLFRSFDIATLLTLFQTLVIFALNPPTWVLVAQCVFWRLFLAGGLGWVLKKQSDSKWVTRHFIKHGGSRQEAFQSWKQIYNLTLIMAHVSFYIVAIRFYAVPNSFTEGWPLLKHTMGVLMLALHGWSSVEMFDVIKEFGWFYGDFFLDPLNPSPEYTGIYRFVNNPEKVLGQASFYGVALISDSWEIFALAVLSNCSMALFLYYVERPHMRRLYGDEVRKESGLKSAVKTKLSPLQNKIKPFKMLGELDRWVDRMSLDAKRVVDRERTQHISDLKKRVDAVKSSVISSADLFITAPRPPLATRKLYSLSVDASESFAIGQPIRIKWTAPPNHPAKDWVAIYLIGQNISQKVTIRTSKGCWSYLPAEEKEGVLELTGSQLPWRAGVYEARLHFDNNHGVVAISEPFEVTHGSEFPREHWERERELSQEQIAATLTNFFRLVLDRTDINSDTEFAAETWSTATRRAVTEFLESTYSVTGSFDVLRKFNTPSLLALWVCQAWDALFTSLIDADIAQDGPTPVDDSKKDN